MMIPIRELLGLGSIPSDRTSAAAWFVRHGVTLHSQPCVGGRRDVFYLSDLPEPERLAFLCARAEAMNLPMGQYDDDAHLAFQAKPVTVQNKGYAAAETMMFIAKHEKAGLKPAQIAALVKEEAAKADKTILSPSPATLLRWRKMIANVDPINWAPALAPNYKGRTVTAKISPEAWTEFEDLVGLSGKNGTGVPLKELWRRIADQKAAKGWHWPPYRTVLRRWNRLDPVRRRTLQFGPEAAARSLTQYQPRTIDGMFAMEQVELDGREFKVLSNYGDVLKIKLRDGSIGCPWVITYTDRASSCVVGFSISTSENEEAAADATIRMCEEHGIPDRIYTDNGAAFNSRRMAGGLKPTFRRKQMTSPDWEVPGVLHILGIELQNAGVGKARSKLSESIFSALRHVDNFPEFHRAQRSGPNDPPNPNPEPVPFEVFEAVVAKAIDDFNNRTDSRAQGLLKGESRKEAFKRLSEGRAKRIVTPLQSRSVRLKWEIRTVNEDGRIRFDHGLYGDASTQNVMARYAGTKVLIGINPDNYHDPAFVRHWGDPKLKGRTLIEELPLYEATRHGDKAGKIKAAAEERRVRSAVKKHEVTDAAQKRKALWDAALEAAPPPPSRETPKVVPLDTRVPFSAGEPVHKRKEPQPAEVAVLEGLRKNLDARKAIG